MLGDLLGATTQTQGAPTTFADRCEYLRVQLGYEAGTPFVDIVERAKRDLGVTLDVPLVQQAEACVAALGAGTSASSQMPTYDKHGAQVAAPVPVATAVAVPIMPVAAPQPLAPVPNVIMQLAPTPPLREFVGKPTQAHAGCYCHGGIPATGAIHRVTAIDERTLQMRGVAWIGPLPFPLNETYTTIDGVTYTTDHDSCGNPDKIPSMGRCFTFESCILGPGCRVSG